jgi:hypothetical protein
VGAATFTRRNRDRPQGKAHFHFKKSWHKLAGRFSRANAGFPNLAGDGKNLFTLKKSPRLFETIAPDWTSTIRIKPGPAAMPDEI